MIFKFLQSSYNKVKNALGKTRSMLGNKLKALFLGKLDAQGGKLNFLSTFSTFGASRDVTIEELRIECLFPADDQTAAVCRVLAR